MSILINVVHFLRSNCSAYKLNSHQKLILFTLAGHIGKRNEWVIKNSELAKECELSLTTFKDNLKVLVDKKLIITSKYVTKKTQINCFSINKELLGTSRDSGQCVEEGLAEIPASPGGTLAEIPASGVAEIPASVPHIDPLPAQQPCGFPAIVSSPKVTYKSNIKDKVTKKEEAVSLPEWLPESDWNDFLAFRKTMKAPMGVVAQKRAISRLTQFHETGQDVHQIIDQSIVNGWKGLFPVKGGFHANGQASSALTHRQATTQRAWDAVKNWQ